MSMIQSLLKRSHGLFNVAVELGATTGVVVFTDSRGRHLERHLQAVTPEIISVKVYPGFSLKRLSERIIDYLDRSRTVSTVYVMSGIEEFMVKDCLAFGKIAVLRKTDVGELTKHVTTEVDKMVKEISKRFPRVKLVLCPVYGLDIAVYNQKYRDAAGLKGKGGGGRGSCPSTGGRNAPAQPRRRSDGEMSDGKNGQSKAKKSTENKGDESNEKQPKGIDNAKGLAGLKSRLSRTGQQRQNVQGGMQGMLQHFKGVGKKEVALQMSEEMIQETLEEAILLINRHLQGINSRTGVLSPRLANLIHPYSVESHERQSQYWRLKDGFQPSSDLQHKLAGLIACAVADNRKLGFHK